MITHGPDATERLRIPAYLRRNRAPRPLNKEKKS